MAIPNWLTRDYIEAALQKFYKDPTLRIIEQNVFAALGKGENFGGVLTRANVYFELNGGKTTKRQTFVVKTSLESDEFAREKMKPYDIFNREMSIYEHVLPKLSALLEGIGDTERLFISAVHIDYERQALIFEDLSEQGYVMANRIQGLDVAHVEMILRKLAKMHAASAVLNEREGGSLETYDRGFFNRYTDCYSSYFVGMVMACASTMAHSMSEYEHSAYFAAKLSALAKRYMAIGKRCFEPTPDHVNVLTHGDVWTNNVMFRYDAVSGRPVDVLIIDFQYAVWGSPSLDLHHFFNTSLHEPVRLHQLDTLVQSYHSIFADTLTRLNYRHLPVPTLHRFRLHAEQKRFFAVHSACFIQPVMMNEDTKDADFNALWAEDERAVNFRSNLYKNRRVQQNLMNLLPMFDKRGLLDANQCD